MSIHGAWSVKIAALWLLGIAASEIFAVSPAYAAQSAPAANSTAESTAQQLAGTDLVAELSRSIDARKAKVGDVVKATLTQDVLAHGRIVLHRGTKLFGRVTEVRIRTKDEGESILGLAFEKAAEKGGREFDLQAGIRALAAAPHVNGLEQADPLFPPVTSSASSSGYPQMMGSGNAGHTNNGGILSRTSTATGSAQGPGPGNTPGKPDQTLLGGGSRGVFGLPGLQLRTDGGAAHATIISSTSRNVKLDNGVQMVIQVSNVAR